MEIICKINFEYNFVVDKGIISNKHNRDVPAILAVDATFTIKINNELYFETELAILEFYASLYSWKEQITKDHIFNIEQSSVFSELPCIFLFYFSIKKHKLE